ncbi:endonuclease/exonuclease/phosphatase family protein [Wenxinia saemankumensis]|uniref:Metal-dependent hydrolase, endonuclease/exonuclease/phosphatase family n=1 Tax=Wenxinia saemankumensis TaxID=1447782 RepID=A0A1M6HUI8_9RHOB|nr:endonuclease/exonuclease/phosphatase family protein [Wenxinia saemankumensis]SHJ25912.1 Metal-dependent hydrolase, endonuclease/exonuclease/phosphatase family [Wenxinia saemankumensis]
MTRVVAALPPVTAGQRAAILAAPRDAGSHRALLADLPAMHLVQAGGAPSADRLGDRVKMVAWNVERCLFPEESARHLAALSPDVVLLSEMDHGMARTAQRHTTEEVAKALGMTYAFAVEFHELGLGGATERAYCTDAANALGWHGNAVLSRVPMSGVRLIRLDDHGHWFDPAGGADPDQPRVGGRLALAAILPSVRGGVCVVSTHLESNSGAAHRDGQMSRLLGAVDEFAPGLPVLIGGDLNTGNHLPDGRDWRDETLFARAERRGYDWSFSAEGPTTRPSLLTPHPDRVMRLDWIAGRGLTCLDRGTLASLDPGGRPLSDHDAVWCAAEPAPR